MRRYIDAIPLIEKWEKECGRGTNNGTCQGDCFDCQFPEAIDELKDAPTVDAVPVVRCKDCVKRPPKTARNGDEPTSDCPLWCGYCFGIDDSYGGEFFCADGERRTDEQ